MEHSILQAEVSATSPVVKSNSRALATVPPVAHHHLRDDQNAENMPRSVTNPLAESLSCKTTAA
jgi:hypothetical protein